MATSGSIDYIVTRDDIITESLELLGVLGEGESPTADQLTSCSRTLNMLIKNWQAAGLNLFAVQRQYLFTEKGVEEYLLGGSSTAKFTETFHATATTVSSSSGSTTITVSDASNISDGDTIGVASGTDVQWTTVNGPVVASVVTLTDTLDNDIPENSVVYTYTQSASRPMKVLEGYVTIQGSNTDIPLVHISRRKYNQLSVKDTRGLVNQIYYDPQITQGSLFVWPTTDDERNYLTLFVQRTLEDVDTSTDNVDYPQEWYMPLAYNLAAHLSPKYGVPSNDYYILERQAAMLFERAQGFDEELGTSMYLTVDYRGEEL